MANAKSDFQEGGLSATLRPARSIRAAMNILHGRDVPIIPTQQGLDEAQAILGLEGLLQQAQEAHPGDLRCQAAFILAAMKRAQR